jgi:hypothetical protein
MLENFWLELAENIMPPLPLPQQFSSIYSTDEKLPNKIILLLDGIKSNQG